MKDITNNNDPIFDIDNNNNQTQSKKCWPEEDPNRKINIIRKHIGDKLFYSYVGSILKRGSQLHALRSNRNRTHLLVKDDIDELTQKDLFQIPKIMDAVQLQTTFKKIYYESQNKDSLLRSSSRSTSRPALVNVLWSLCSSLYIPAGLYQLVNVIIQSTFPLLVRKLLKLFEEHPQTNFASEGIPWAVALFVFSVVGGIAQERYKFLSFQSGIQIRAASIGAIYNHMLRLSPNSGVTNGEVTNLVAVDCQKVFEVTQEG